MARSLAGHDVVLEQDARRALRLLEGTLRGGPSFDLVLCDLHMPELTGKELYLRCSAASPSLARRFVFMSGGGEDIDTELADTGQPILDKPFGEPQLHAALEQLKAAASVESH